MPVQSRQRVIHEEQLEKYLDTLPGYVVEYILAKKRLKYSPSTLLGYVHEYIKFLTWLQTEGISRTNSIKEIRLSLLEDLEKESVELYIDHISHEDIRSIKERDRKEPLKTRSDAAVDRSLNALKSLFNYLTRETEVTEGERKGECYFYRNVFAKIKFKRDQETANYRAKKINAATLQDNEATDFIEFLKNTYEKSLNNRQKIAFLKNKERDIAIISLMLGSGIRVSEVSDLLLTDLDLRRNEIDVIRKGNKKDTINVLPSSMTDLMSYLEVRELKYKTTPEDYYVFVTYYGGKVNAISPRAIQKLVNTYTKAYNSINNLVPGTGKGLSPHKLRHSFANHWTLAGGSLPQLRDQLGHTSIETTAKYTNLSSKEGKKILSNIDSSRKK